MRRYGEKMAPASFRRAPFLRGGRGETYLAIGLPGDRTMGRFEGDSVIPSDSAAGTAAEASESFTGSGAAALSKAVETGSV